MATGDLDHRVDVAEVHDLRDVRLREPWSVRVAIDGDDAKPERTRLRDRSALMPACADEENRLHDGETLRARCGQERSQPLPAADLAAVAAAELRPDADPAEAPGDAGDRGSAVD